MDLVTRGDVQTSPLISKVIDPDRLEETFRELRDHRHELVQVVVKCN